MKMSSESNSKSFNNVAVLEEPEFVTSLALSNLLLSSHVGLEGELVDEVTSTTIDVGNELSRSKLEVIILDSVMLSAHPSSSGYVVIKSLKSDHVF